MYQERGHTGWTRPGPSRSAPWVKGDSYHDY
nr:MAG TPA: hypothetical protein [Caudoviricetes sp.]